MPSPSRPYQYARPEVERARKFHDNRRPWSGLPVTTVWTSSSNCLATLWVATNISGCNLARNPFNGNRVDIGMLSDPGVMPR